MLVLFGDSWARQAHYHTQDPDAIGYQHWQFSNVKVATRSDIWLQKFFKNHSALNLAEFGNDLDTIIKNIYNFKNITQGFKEKINFIVFQTDPLRIFAPRMSYTDYNVVWPNFERWCKQLNLDWTNFLLDDLVQVIFTTWYTALKNIELTEQQSGSINKVYLVGGVSKVYHCGQHSNLEILMPSVSEHFGLSDDCVFENRSSLACFVDFWSRHLNSKQTQLLRQQWYRYEELLIKKEQFWTSDPEHFAGRHLTALGMEKLANYIECKIS